MRKKTSTKCCSLSCLWQLLHHRKDATSQLVSHDAGWLALPPSLLLQAAKAITENATNQLLPPLPLRNYRSFWRFWVPRPNRFTPHLLWLHFFHNPFGYFSLHSPRPTLQTNSWEAWGRNTSRTREEEQDEQEATILFGTLHSILHTAGMVVVGNVVFGSRNILSVKAWPSMR
jgi:hypothetical protein